jgi:hypothetical protein
VRKQTQRIERGHVMSDTVPRINIDVPAELHTRAKLVVVKKGQGWTLKRAVIEALTDWVKHAEAEGQGEGRRRRR